MNEYECKLKRFIERERIECEHLSFDQSCHSVAEAAQAVGARAEDLVKNICLLDAHDAFIVAIVKGEDRVSTSRIAKALHTARPRMAKPAEILAKSGYPCGGTPSFGYQALFLIDPRVMDWDTVYTGGGSESSLVKIKTQTLLAANRGTIARIRK